MPGGSDVSLEKRAVVVAYAFDLAMPQVEIASRLSLHKNTVQSIITRTKRRSNSLVLSDLLLSLKNEGHGARERLVEPGSAAFMAVRDTVRDLKYHNQQEAANHTKTRRALQELDVNIPHFSEPSTRRILKDPEHCHGDSIDSRPVKRKRELVKPGGYNPSKRLHYATELHELIEQEPILIVCDEKKYGFGGTANTHVSLPAGEDSYKTSNTVRFTLEQWAAATGQDTSIQRPHCVWTEEDKLQFKFKQRLEDANARRRFEVDNQRDHAVDVPDSEDAIAWYHANWEVTLSNWHRRRRGIKGQQLRITLQRQFPYKDMRQASEKLDFCWYAFAVYEERLFPYVLRLRKAYPHRRVIIVEDNSPVHIKARELVHETVKRLRIEFAQHTPFSPDLNPCETLHREQRKPLVDYIVSITSAAKSIQREAASKLKAVWQSKEFDGPVTKYCSLDAFKSLANKVKEVQGHNNFKDQ